MFPVLRVALGQMEVMVQEVAVEVEVEQKLDLLATMVPVARAVVEAVADVVALVAPVVMRAEAVLHCIYTITFRVQSVTVV